MPKPKNLDVLLNYTNFPSFRFPDDDINKALATRISWTASLDAVLAYLNKHLPEIVVKKGICEIFVGPESTGPTLAYKVAVVKYNRVFYRGSKKDQVYLFLLKASVPCDEREFDGSGSYKWRVCGHSVEKPSSKNDITWLES